MADTTVAAARVVPRRVVSPPALSDSRLPYLALGGIALLAGLAGGLQLIGVRLPGLPYRLAVDHGPLMALGFLGTVIALERAVALRQRWALASPLTSGLGSLALVLGLPAVAGQLLISAGAVVLLLTYLTLLRRAVANYLVIQALGAVSWYVASLLWLTGRPVSDMVPALAAFLILTIVGERLDLARIGVRTRTASRLFVAAATGFGIGVGLASLVALGEGTAPLGTRVAAVGMIGFAAWLARWDVTRRTIRLPGLPRFIAACLLAGYVWLGAGGALWLAFGRVDVGSAYDAVLHAIFLGFVMSMVIAHAPVILPAVLRVRMPYTPWLYVAPVLLNVSLLIRLAVGDGLGSEAVWRATAMANVAALLLFIGGSVAIVLRGRRA
jgi:hypothetical protein